MGGRRSLLKTTRRWRDSVHPRCGRVAPGILRRCVSSSGAESHTVPRGWPKPAAHSCQIQLRAAQIRSAERSDARVTSRPRSEYADVTDMLRHLMTLHEQSSQCRRQREVIIERCLPLADHIARWFSNRGEPLERSRPGGTDGSDAGGEPLDAANGADVLAFAVPTMMGEVRRILPRSRMVGEGSPQNERARFPAQ